MNISDESLKLLQSVVFNNPKHSPTGHPCDRNRWLEFVISNYKNNEYIESWDLYEYFMNNGFRNFEDEVVRLIDNYQHILDFISCLDKIKDDESLVNVQWLIEELNS